MDQQPEAYKRKGPKPKSFVIRLLSHIKTNENGCFIWLGSKNNKGYGMLNVDRMPALAHRVSYELFVGDLEDGLVVDHLCRNRGCINPAHLEQVTSRDNVLRGDSVCSENSKKTHCKRGHEFSGENMRLLKNGGRFCKKCRIIRDENRYQILTGGL